MGIEQDISQAKFRSEYQKATINLIYTFNWMNEQIKNMLDQYDITPQQFNILRILRGAGKPISTFQIRQRMLDKMSDTSRIVDRLIKKDLVKKVICEGDRRLVDVSISAALKRNMVCASHGGKFFLFVCWFTHLLLVYCSACPRAKYCMKPSAICFFMYACGLV